MANKRSKVPGTNKFFTPPGAHNPLGNIIAEGANIVVRHGLTRLSCEAARLLGVSGTSTKNQIDLNRSQMQLEKQKADLYRAQILSEKQLRMFDLKIQEKEIDIEKRRRLLENIIAQKTQLGIPITAEVVEGALEVMAVADGFNGSSEQSEGYVSWLESFEGGKVIVIIGRRGSGKTALAAKIGEYMMATHKMPIYWIGLPAQARSLLPNWIRLVDSPDKCPVGCFMIIDEAGIQYLSLAFSTDRNRLLRALLMVCRQRHSSLVFAVQSSRDMEYSIVRQADTIIFKEPGLHQPDSERPDIRPLAKKAALAFNEIPRGKKREAAFVFDDDFQGLITSTVPSFWSEELSHVYAHFDLTAMEYQVQRDIELQQTAVKETKLLNAASEDKEILELRQQGYGTKRIAKTLGCTEWRVRKCLEN